MTLHRRIGLLVFALAVAAPAARAAEDYDGCAGFIDSLPAVIAQQGTWCLRGDLSTAITGGRAIEVAANNVTIDCNDFKLGGLAAGPTSKAAGVYAYNRQNLTVRRCNIRGFGTGVFARGGVGHLVEDNRFEANLSSAVVVDEALVRDNLVLDTGGYAAGLLATGIRAYGTSDVLDNSISGVFVASDGGAAAGVRVFGSLGGTVSGNRIGGLLPGPGGGEAVGIELTGTSRIAVQDNTLQSTLAAATSGILCDGPQARLRDNMISGFGTTTSGCGDAGGND